MTARATTIILSDLHVGGGPQDRGDDHVFHKRQLERFVDEQTGSPEGQAGGIEMLFNGDFLEFAQVNTAAFDLVDDACWCTEQASLAKLETMLAGHPGIFDALGRFLRAGNAVTLAAGNHDVDLAWPKVQARLRERIGPALAFEIGKTWVERHDGLLQVGHGHMDDTANRFRHWDEPIRISGWRQQVLEMCPGTLFMVKFVNALEATYPFADNLLPVTKLVSVLARERRIKAAGSIAWAFSRFCATASGRALLGTDESAVGRRLQIRYANDPEVLQRLENTLRAQSRSDVLAMRGDGAPGESFLASAAFALLGRIPMADWDALFAVDPSTATLGNGDGTTLALTWSLTESGKEDLRRAAQKRIDDTGAQVVVMGHTHQQDEVSFDDGGVYYNPGSWTRYLDARELPKVTFEDLKDESKYPYALNVVRVSRLPDGRLDSRLICIDRDPPV